MTQATPSHSLPKSDLIGEAAQGSGPVHLRWPHQRFYWALIPLQAAPSSLTRLGTAQSRAWLDGAFTAHIPRDIDRVATAYARLPSGLVVACGLPVESLTPLRLANLETLTPRSLPEWLGETIDPSSLNVLVGSYEPLAMISLRRRRSGLMAASLAIAATLVAVGFQRGAASDRRATSQARDLLQRLAESPIGRAYAKADEQALIDDARVAFDLHRMHATRSSAAQAAVGDVVPTLELLLAHWPRQMRAQVQSLTATSSQVTLNVLLPAHEDADTLVASLKSVKGVEASQPQISAGTRGVTLQLTLKPAVPIPTFAPTPTPTSTSAPTPTPLPSHTCTRPSAPSSVASSSNAQDTP